MPDTDRLNELLLEWEERRDGGQPVSAEELCRDTPELLPQLKARIQALESMDGMLDGGALPAPSAPTEARRPTADNTNHRKELARTFEASFHLPGYEILSELGRGGMGVVYKARQTTLKRLVALKTFLPGEQVRGEDLARFTVEAQSSGRLQHPNIVQVYDVGDSDGRPWFSLELVEGGTLEEKMELRRWSAKEAAQLIEILARAVHYAHARDVIHRDLKPSNILFAPLEGSSPSFSTSYGVPKISDFGLAKCLQAGGPRLTKKGTVLGTPSYMAPEQAAGKSDTISPATDVHALGAMLYELLVGHPPFDADSVYETLRQVIRNPAEPPSKFDPSIPAPLEQICMKCLEKEPARRYASAEELAEDLRRFTEGKSVKGAKGAAGFWRRHALKMGVLAVVAAVVAALFLLRPKEATFSPEQISRQATELRPPLLDAISKVRTPEGWIMCKVGPDANPKLDIEVWGHSQALADTLLGRQLRTDQVKTLATGLENPFLPGWPIEKDGIKFGWRAFPSADYTVAPPAMQTGLALTGAVLRPGLLSRERKQIALDNLRYTQQVLNLYRPERFTGSWNMFPRQKDPTLYSGAVTAMALQFLLELRRAELPWEDSEQKRDDLLAKTVKWIDEAFEPNSDPPGWREGRGFPIGDGLTLMLYSLRMRAETEAGIRMPPDMFDKVLPHLLRCESREWDHVSTQSFLWYPFQNFDGQEISRQQTIVIGWYRWALVTSVLWLERHKKHPASSHDVQSVNRVLGHLVMDIGEPIVNMNLVGWTFNAADDLHGLSSIPPP
jgi:hypothetical protein